MNFEHLTYYELINDFNKDFLIDYGRIKYDKVYNKVHSSEKISKLILLSKESRLTPLAKDFLYTINSIPFFIFSKSDTIALGSLLSLERWNKECNIYYNLANEFILKDISVKILNECLYL